MTRLFAALALASCSCAAIAAAPEGPVRAPPRVPVPALIVNSVDAPVPVSVAIQAVESVNSRATSQIGNPTVVLYQVPGDRRLEVEFASVRASRFLEPTETLFVFIRTTVQGVEGQFLVGSVLGGKVLADSRQITLSADPGTTITMQQASFEMGPDFINGRVCMAGRLTPI